VQFGGSSEETDEKGDVMRAMTRSDDHRQDRKLNTRIATLSMDALLEDDQPRHLQCEAT
jgi:hypothetical protein